MAVIDIRLRIRHGAKIPELCRKLQSNVKEAVQNMTGVVVENMGLTVWRRSLLAMWTVW